MPRERFEEETTAATLAAGARGERVLRALVFWDGGSYEQRLPARGTVTVGRSRDCLLRINHHSVSRLHAELRIGDDQASGRPRLELIDCGSANGTRLRGRLLVPGRAAAVAPGDVSELGSVLLIVRTGLSGEIQAPLVAAAPPEAEPLAPEGMIVADPSMKRLLELVLRVARGDINVLLLGETGAGKEVFAEAIHRGSSRAGGPFVAVNCAALPDSLFESELFGHERGAFTGASASKQGLLEAANHGTVFLDEVGELSAPAQAKLLRVVEKHEVTRVGRVTPMAIDVRFIAATHRALEQSAADGSFRQDLYFRLNGAPITIPPLRERRGEIGLFAERFAADACARMGRPRIRISPAAHQALQRHDWPGNVREVRNVIERAVLLCQGDTIDAADLALAPALSSAPPASAPAAREPRSDVAPTLKVEVSAIERRRILEALEQCAGNQSRAAKALGISRRRLLNRLDDYGVARPRKGS